MAIWTDISHLKGPPGEEDNIIDSEWCVGPITYFSSPELSFDDFIPLRVHNATTSCVSASKFEKLRAFDGDDIQNYASETSTISGSIGLSPSSDDCYCFRSVDQPQLQVESAALPDLSYQRRLNADYLGDITFSTPCPDESTFTISFDYAEGIPLLYTANTKIAHTPISYEMPTGNGAIEYLSQYDSDADRCNEDGQTRDKHGTNTSLGIEGGAAFRLSCPSNALKITLETDQRMFFNVIEQAEFDRLLTSEGTLLDTQPDGEFANPADIEGFWIEVDYKETPPQDVQDLDSTYDSDDDSIEYASWEGPLTPEYDEDAFEVYEPLDKLAQVEPEDDDPKWYHCSPSETFDVTDFDSEIDTPLSYFQPLQIGPFAPNSPPNDLLPKAPPPKNHSHPLPTLSQNPQNNTLQVTFTIDENWNCSVFEVFRTDIVPLTGLPVLLSRRVYELQGYIQEKQKRKTERAFRRFMSGWTRVRSPLAAEWHLEGGDKDEEEFEVRLVVRNLEER